METIDIVIFLLITCAAFLGFAAIKSYRNPVHKPKTRLKRRLDLRNPGSEASNSATDSFDQWFTRLVVKSGIKLDVKTVSVLLGCVAVLAGAIGFVADWQPFLQLLFSVTVFLLGIGVIHTLTSIRIRKFATQFPTALDLMARSTRTGGNLETALAIAGNNSEQPIQGEFDHCVKQLQLGSSAGDVAQDLASRIGNMDTRLFAHTVGVHQNLGGRLGDALERLAEVIRDRTEYTEKVRSITGIGRFAVVAIVFMAIFVFLFLMLAYPEYLAKLYISKLGQKMLIYAAISELVGLIWVAMTLKSEF